MDKGFYFHFKYKTSSVLSKKLELHGEKITNLNSSPYDDSHQEVGDDTSYCHHQALDDCDTTVEAQNKEEIVFEAWVKADHEITNSSRNKSDHY